MRAVSRKKLRLGQASKKRDEKVISLQSQKEDTVCFLDKWPQTKFKVTFDTMTRI